MKVLFFHVPSLGMYHLIEPILLELVRRGHTVIHYNHGDFRRYVGQTSIGFRPYRDYQGYLPSLFHSGMNVYDLGLMLLDTAEHMVDFVDAAVVDESADVILHSKFMAAPKVVARKHGTPAACLTTGFVFQPDLVLDHRKDGRAPLNLSNVSSLWKFRKRARRFYETYLDAGTDVNDVFVNEEILNLVLGLDQFQPGREKISPAHRFIGPTVRIPDYSKSYELVYVSLGSIFADNQAFFQVCMHALAGVGRRVVMSLSDRLSPDAFESVPPNIELRRFVPQREVLQQAALFITHGGASSVYEAIYCATPMIVIPQIPEQLFYARAIEALALGRCIVPEELTAGILRATVTELLENDSYRANVQTLKEGLPSVAPAVTASDYIEQIMRKPEAVASI